MTYSIDWLVQQYADFFEKFGIGRQILVAHFEEWKNGNTRRSVTDYVWYLFDVLIGETKKQVSNPVDYHRNLHEILLTMLSFRVNVEAQKDNNLVQAIIKNKVQLWQHELPYPFRLQAVSLNCCPHCEQINGQIFSVDAILTEPYFASEQCTAPTGCSCGYIPVADGVN